MSNQIIGYEYIINHSIFFFGTINGSFEQIQNAYPKLAFTKINQVHGTSVVETNYENPHQEADAHWTSQKNVGLLISTADCIPLLISHRDFVCSVHAGWRGVRHNIVSVAVEKLYTLGAKTKDLTLAIGPHINKNSFEVDKCLADDFQNYLSSIYCSKSEYIFVKNKINDKAYIDLFSIVIEQLSNAGIPKSCILSFSADTKTDMRFASYRRDNMSPKRNLSFVARL